MPTITRHDPHGSHYRRGYESALIEAENLPLSAIQSLIVFWYPMQGTAGTGGSPKKSAYAAGVVDGFTDTMIALGEASVDKLLSRS